MNNQNDILKELNEHFNAFKDLKDLKDDDKYFSNVVKYFNFIKDTYPLNTIADSIFSSSKSNNVLINNIKKAFLSGSAPPIGIRGFSTFHSLIIENAKRVGLTKQEEVVIHIGDEKKICRLVDEKPLCYTEKWQDTKRFKIILMLLLTKTGKSAKEIAIKITGFASKISQENIKKEVKAINKNFQKECDVSEELISHNEQGNKNIYFLNREHFIFKKKK